MMTINDKCLRFVFNRCFPVCNNAPACDLLLKGKTWLEFHAAFAAVWQDYIVYVDIGYVAVVEMQLCDGEPIGIS